MTELPDNGVNPRTAPLVADGGEFQRQETDFRDWIQDEADSPYPPEPGRYHLYISRACPWAHGTALVRRLEGLEDIISMDIVDPYRESKGWRFTPEKEGCTADTVNGFDYLYQVYEAADSDFSDHVSVPVLWDRQRETIVNNESIDIMRMLDSAFTQFGNGVSLNPRDRRSEIDRIVDDIYESINNGVYRAGFARTQDAYERAVSTLFDAFDHWDGVLADQRYLVGPRLTLADLRLFATLVRFDQVYHTHFKCNKRFVNQYDNLWPYLRDIYQTPGVAQTVNMDHIKEHYYTTHPDLNPTQIIAVGPDLDFTAPHDRDRLPGGPPAELSAAAPGD